MKIPTFLRRRQNPSQRFDRMESSESLDSSPRLAHKEHETGATETTDVSTNIDIPRKKHGRRIRTVSGSSGHSCQSEPTPKTRRIPNFSTGSNFSGDSIIHHLDKLSERDQVWFQAYRFGGR